MKKSIIFLFIISLALPALLAAQPQDDPIFVMQGYGESTEAPIKISAGAKLQTQVGGYFINERRYTFYRKLHEFANDAEFKGHEKEIIDGFGGFLADSDEILRKMTENTSKLEASSESLKTAQDAVDQLNAQVDELARQNRVLQDKLNTPVKQEKKWAVPVLLGVVAGITIGVLIQ